VKSDFQWRAAPSGMNIHGRLQRKSTTPNPVYRSFLNTAMWFFVSCRGNPRGYPI